jgi:hypothetical protein
MVGSASNDCVGFALSNGDVGRRIGHRLSDTERQFYLGVAHLDRPASGARRVDGDLEGVVADVECYRLPSGRSTKQ